MVNENKSNIEYTSKKQLLRRRLLSGITVFFIFISMIYLIYWTFSGRFYETTDDAYVSGNLVQVMPQTSGQVINIYADETDLVKKGRPVVLLNQTDATIALKNAESQLALTVRQVDQLYNNVNELRAKVNLQQDNFEKTQEDYRRRKGLVAGKTISTEELRHAKIAVDTATDTLNLVKNQLAAAIALVGNTDLYHHPQVLSAAAKYRKAYLAWERTTIYAPETGYVAKRPVQVGQQVTPNTVLMIIVPLNQVWVNANFKESQLANFRINQSVELISDIYGSAVKYQGHIIGLNPGSGNAFDLLPPQNATGNWIKIVQRLPVRIAIDPKQLIEHPLRVGLSMTVTVNTHDRNNSTLTMLPQEKILYQTEDYNYEPEKVEQLINQVLTSNAENIHDSSTK